MFFLSFYHVSAAFIDERTLITIEQVKKKNLGFKLLNPCHLTLKNSNMKNDD